MANSYTRTLLETMTAMSLIPKPAGVLANHNPVGPISSAFTPSALAASRNPASALCQYDKLMFVATNTYRSLSSR